MPPAIRWDRLSRYGLLAVLGVLLVLYVNPLRHYVSTVRQAHRRAADVHALEKANRALRDQAKALSDRSVLATKARSLGMVLPGERSYVVTGLPRGG
jgi:cell division protein FtsB